MDEIEEENGQDIIDPWGIVNKPLRVLNDKAKWICEALFGRYLPIIYPCHICYTVYELEDELKEHFRLSHPGLENCCDNGPHYDRERELYVCPVCKRQVCHKQKSAIYFTHHLRKCSGDTHPVSRSCPQCNKTFTSFRPYMFHTKNNCETKEFMCHICSQNFKDVKYLASHLSYVHSTARPYQCTKCDKSYKRRPELRMHMQTHQDTMEYSCEKCGKAFHRKRILKIHMTTHLSEAEKRYACHLCSHRFSKKSFLVNHLTTHSSFRRFACEVCGSQVKTRDSLKQHRKRVHKLNTPLLEACILQVETEIDPKLTTTTTVVVKEETVIEEFQF
jgi:DNA-directed RNA polymerase subunit RPC12/RpoP